MHHLYIEKDLDRIRNWIINAVERLLNADEELLKNRVHENAINHRLAVHLEFLKDNYNIDGYDFDT